MGIGFGCEVVLWFVECGYDVMVGVCVMVEIDDVVVVVV